MPALALCCCEDHGDQNLAGAEVQPAAEQAHCHGEPTAENRFELSAEQSVCMCEGGHVPQAFEPAKAVHVQAQGLSLEPPAPTTVSMADSPSPMLDANRARGVSLPHRHILHCVFLI